MKSIFILLLIGGLIGYFIDHNPIKFGATTARTTITNPWIFTATTTFNGNLAVTTTNAATSTLQIGCIQTTATSTATPIRLVIGSTRIGTTTYEGIASVGVVAWQYGYCPKLP